MGGLILLPRHIQTELFKHTVRCGDERGLSGGASPTHSRI
jgi:hypothetical protein